MTVGDLIEKLIKVKDDRLWHPESGYVDLACNVLEQFPVDADIFDVIQKLKEVNND